MLYLPRLFVYHCSAEPGSVQSETFKVMERRLLRAIINPAMIATWLLGLWLAWHGPDMHYGWFASGWLEVKLALVIILSGVHGLFARWVKAFAADRQPALAKILSHNQRGTDDHHDCHRAPGGAETVLSRRR